MMVTIIATTDDKYINNMNDNNEKIGLEEDLIKFVI